VGVFFVARRHRWWPLALVAAAVAGAVGLYGIVKFLVGRPRPPSAIWIGHYSGAAFPSGHATQSVAFYATLAIILGAGRSAAAKTMLWGAAALIVAIIGASRIYLGAHWLTDVLGGYALGACWVAVITAAALLTWRPAGPGKVPEGMAHEL
jgi:membrane-associated phospholipid phosphatase